MQVRYQVFRQQQLTLAKGRPGSLKGIFRILFLFTFQRAQLVDIYALVIIESRDFSVISR
jgi:hypothetical protein